MSNDGTAIPGQGEGTPLVPNFQAVGQYIKDLSFENLGPPAGLTERPHIYLGVDVQARRAFTARIGALPALAVQALGADPRHRGLAHPARAP